MTLSIIGFGASVPEEAHDNASLEATLGLSNGWVERRTGIRRRPIAAEDQATSDLAVHAGRAALDDSGLDPRDIDLLLLATSTPDHPLPPTAPLVAHSLGLSRAGAIDLAGACSGFLYALSLADAHCRTRSGHALVIGANLLSRRVNPRDAATASLFADGAGAVVLGPSSISQGLLAVDLHTDGTYYDSIRVAGGGTRAPLTEESIRAGAQFMVMEKGPLLFRHVVRMMAESARRVLDQADITIDNVDWWIPHQANRRITREVGRLLSLPLDRTIDVVANHGNSSAATIPIALSEAKYKQQIRQGQTLLLTAVGAGIICSSILLEL